MLSARGSKGKSSKLSKRAARQKIKEEKTFQCELFTVVDSGASDVPLQPDFQLQNEERVVFNLCLTEQSKFSTDAVLLSSSFYYLSEHVSTVHSLSPPLVSLKYHCGC